MECLHPTLSHLFICLPTLELTTFEQQVCSPKIGYTNALELGTNSRKKKECDHFEQSTSSKKGSATLTVIGLDNIRAPYSVSSKFSEPKRFVWRLNKVEGKYIQEQQPS